MPRRMRRGSELRDTVSSSTQPDIDAFDLSKLEARRGAPRRQIQPSPDSGGGPAVSHRLHGDLRLGASPKVPLSADRARRNRAPATPE